MEFVRVLFPTSRRVRIDGNLSGTTNRPLQVQAGMHRFELDGALDYSPPFVIQAVGGTTNIFPLIIQFVPLAAALPVPEPAVLDSIAPEPAAPSRKRAARRRRPAASAGKKARKAPAKKKPAAKKKTSAKKTSAKKTSAKKAPAKKRSSKKASKRK